MSFEIIVKENGKTIAQEKDVDGVLAFGIKIEKQDKGLECDCFLFGDTIEKFKSESDVNGHIKFMLYCLAEEIFKEDGGQKSIEEFFKTLKKSSYLDDNQENNLKNRLDDTFGEF